MSVPGDGIEVRATSPEDREAILGLLATSLGWSADEAGRRRFAWQHERAHFGPTLGWCAMAGGRMVALRQFMPWELEAPDGAVVLAARAVDTVTHPEHRRRGLSRRLALVALEQLRLRGVAFVLNTPNEQSRLVYASLDWRLLRNCRIAWRPTRPGALLRYRWARGRPEQEMSMGGGSAVGPALADEEAVAFLLAARARSCGLRTRLSPGFLRWRYRDAPIAYRAVTAPSGAADGLAIVRMRRHGPLRELLVCELLVPARRRGAEGALLRRLARLPGVDVVERLAGGPIDRRGFVAQRRPEWQLFARGVCAAAPVALRAISLGDVEIF